MQKTVLFQRTEALHKAVGAFRDRGGFLTEKSADRFLLSGIIPSMQKHSAYRFMSGHQDNSGIEKGSSRVDLPSQFLDAIDRLADLYCMSRSSFLRNAEWLALELEAEVNPEEATITTEEFRRRVAEALPRRLPMKLN